MACADSCLFKKSFPDLCVERSISGAEGGDTGTVVGAVVSFVSPPFGSLILLFYKGIYEGLKWAGQADAFPVLTTAAGLVGVFIFGFFHIIGTLYFAKDSEGSLSLPVTPCPGVRRADDWCLDRRGAPPGVDLSPGVARLRLVGGAGFPILCLSDPNDGDSPHVTLKPGCRPRDGVDAGDPPSSKPKLSA